VTQDFSVRAGLSARQAGDLAVIVEEWIANVVEHGDAAANSLINLGLAAERDRVRIAVTDAGKPFNPGAAAFAGPNPQRGGGAGLAMIASLSRIAGYARRSGRNRLMLEMALS
jgi:anti-sigma regulatory factor (Ser/Thr protein kinase)